MVTRCALAFVFFASIRCLAVAEDWPQWLGPARNGCAVAPAKLPEIPANLKSLWRRSIGEGFSSPVVQKDSLVYCDEDGKNEVAHLLDARTGKEVWKAELADRFADEWSAGPRSTPVIDGNRVYVLSCNGSLLCLNLADGKVIWRKSFEQDFGVKFLGSKAREGTASRRGNNGSCLVDGDHLIVPVGGVEGATLVCFDKTNGRVIWKSGKEEAAYSSPQVATIHEVRQVIYLSADSLSGFDRRDGTILWSVPLKTAAKRHAATPIIRGNNVIVNSHTFGVQSFSVEKNGEGRWQAKQIWSNKGLKINLATPVVVSDFLFSQGPDKTYVCADARTGVTKWSQAGFGKENSSTIVVGEKLLVLTDAGELVVIAADPSKCLELSRQQVCGKNWNYPALANGRLYVRDARELICYPITP